MVLDTNILIAYLGGDENVISAINSWFAENLALLISAVTYTEVLALREADNEDLTIMRTFLDSFVFIAVDKVIAEEAAAIKRTHKLKFPDATIVATAIHTNSVLVTRDKRLHRIAHVTPLVI